MIAQAKSSLGSSEESLDVSQLIVKLKATAKSGEDDPVLFRGDRQLVYGRVSEVISAVREVVTKKFTFVSGPEDIEQGAGPGWTQVRFKQSLARGSKRERALRADPSPRVCMRRFSVWAVLNIQTLAPLTWPNRSRLPLTW